MRVLFTNPSYFEVSEAKQKLNFQSSRQRLQRIMLVQIPIQIQIQILKTTPISIPNSQGQQGKASTALSPFSISSSKAEVQLSTWPSLSHGESIYRSPPKIVFTQYFPTKIETKSSAKVQ